MVLLNGLVCVVLMVWVMLCDIVDFKIVFGCLVVGKGVCWLFLVISVQGYMMWQVMNGFLNQFVVVVGIDFVCVLFYVICYVFVMYLLEGGVDLWVI